MLIPREVHLSGVTLTVLGGRTGWDGKGGWTKRRREGRREGGGGAATSGGGGGFHLSCGAVAAVEFIGLWVSSCDKAHILSVHYGPR